ncbi:MAG: single-stranded-DNA-specific exonuclease RecJ, partial [Candidatus Margulisbacteria bacterium]|nr:single-stranded-DNA-specific exonuclease RecJ [Candidatus Margulisiibacteriota bacterium]
DPKDIPGLVKAAERVLLAKKNNEKVVVFGDYDVDGVTATSIMVETLKFLGINTSYHIPHRHQEGYGLSIPAIEKLAQGGAQLIITVDCGISNLAEIARAKQLGLDVIVTDHHNLPAKLPQACAIVNPKIIQGDHPAKELAGAGVAFKFAWGLLRVAGNRDSKFLLSLLDLAALGTLADVVPLHAENRILAVLGMRVINERRRAGIVALADVASLADHITVSNIYFAIAPRINAAGRLDHARQAAELLLTQDPSQAKKLAVELNEINVKRRSIGDEIREAVFEQINDTYLAANKVVVLSGDDWHPGVIGITASKVVDSCARPAVLVGVVDGEGRGSARSIEGVNIFEILSSCADLFSRFGGHKGAAGFSIAQENIPILKERLAEVARLEISDEALMPKLMIDAEIKPTQLNLNLVKQLEKLEPYGQDNPQPIFMSSGLKIMDMKKVGKTGSHFKAKFCNNDVILDTIAFSKGNWADELSYDKRYDLAYRLEANEWNGFENVQLSLVDVRES